MIEAGIYSLLSTESSITDLVSTRIYPVLLPTNAVFPAITYQIVGGQSQQTQDTSGLQMRRVQFDCWATDEYFTAATVREALTKFLNCYGGLLSDGTYLQAAYLIQPIDFYAGQNEAFRCAVEFEVFFVFPS